MENILNAALRYREQGFSVIPVKQDKKPYIKWERYQTEKAEPDTILKWWKLHPDANVGIITGAISGIDVLDADSEKGRNGLNKYLSGIRLFPTINCNPCRKMEISSK